MFYPNLNLYLSIKFKYKPGINHGSAILKVKNKKVSCAFDIDFETARHSYLIIDTRHPNTPPKRKTNPYDSLTTIKDLDTLIRRIEYIFHVEELDDLIESFIRNSFIKKYIEKKVYAECTLVS